MPKTIKTLEDFQSLIRKATDQELQRIGKQLEEEIGRKRNPALALGHAMMIEAVYIEVEMREPVSPETEAMTTEQLLAELGA